MIEVIDLYKSFPIAGKELVILKGVTIGIQKGELLAIVGASGVGKSTLLHLLGALDRPTSGKVFFEGIDLFSRSDRELAEFRNRKIGYVFQFHHLLPEFTALENVMMPGLIQRMERQKIETAAREMLEAVGLGHRLTHRPGQLSGGEQQRVAIARALVLQPQLILADEPTGNLDTHTSDEVFSLLKKLNRERGTTFVLVTHNEKLSLQADRLIKMVDGKIEGA
ncbi:MAG: ABC transporter ATP-binding protein [Candidatus Manganitrophus sp.]|uniref:ABC transporter ATP-binding protein n=1 Tax=Candidatus Manganitrophus noduliformans TaxID=2606439 RepID=A0A7X6DQR4_9BACT|nr:ABC transporter ATP-binding protein [Candidatus Manganitrophus noduliformans]NKE71594.1 ABC transporter ATP-binding protein [Candidatus Manganitrophus noduliformans]WDT76641.1 MAG: ABC transporter ATP-binding protein [Candidatus Manganitrophus sp.]